MDKKHCLHSTADSLHHWPAGKTQYRCCDCGEYFNVPWKLEEPPIEGHGPYTHGHIRVYEWPTTECPRSCIHGVTEAAIMETLDKVLSAGAELRDTPQEME